MDKVEAFRALHVPGDPLVLFNIWDAGSAKAVADGGAKAIATGSYGVAEAQGFKDGETLPLDIVLENLRRIVSITALPVTIDMELKVGLQLARMFGFVDDPARPDCAFGHLTSGGTLANFQALRLALACKAFPVARPEDLRGKSVGLVRGYAYPDLRALIDEGLLDRRNALNEAQLLEMLAKSRFDQIVVNKAIAQYSLAKIPEYRDLEIGDVMSSFDISMRVQPRHEAWVGKLDAAILTLKQRGVIDAIYARYGIHL